MAVMNTIPPQAYTRDVLVKAIEWMQTQPPAIREKATSADLLVSFYMNACRRNGGPAPGGRIDSGYLEAPVSQENFKADLKHLAEGLKQFEDPVAPPPHQPGRFPSYGVPEAHQRVEPLFTPDFHDEPIHHQPAPPPPVYHPPPYTPPAYTSPPRPQQAQGVQWSVDARSLAAARDLQQRMNLSSEGEALRMLIALGSQRAQELFP